MSSADSLTDAVKAVATHTTSLTDAVKEAARSSSDGTIVSFPSLVPETRREVRRDTAVPVVRSVRTEPASLDVPGSAPVAATAHPRPSRSSLEEVREGPVPAPPLAASRRPRLRLRARGPSRLVRLGRGLARLGAALPGAASLRAPVDRIRLAALRLTGVIALACLSVMALPNPVGSGSDQPLPAAMQRRAALVVGNSAYRYARRLDNPRNDAVDISAALQRLGFRVIEGFDLDKVALEGKVREFVTALRGADVGVFFYAGHGLNVAGQNYLVPVDAQLAGASALDLELVRLDLVHRSMEREARTSILFFDACRDSPLSDSLARAMGTRSAEIGRGLGVVQGSAGTLISFSTQPGTLALDGKGRNSPYSAALTRQLAMSHEDLGTMLIAVRNEVMKETGSRQVPWEHSALTGRFYFNPAAEPAGGAARTSAAPSVAHEAFEAWVAAKDTASPAVLEAFVARYGDTFYAELARARMAELGRHSAGTATSSLGGPGPSLER